MSVQATASPTVGTNPFAVASLVLAVVSCVIPVLFLPAIAAVVLGHKALAQLRGSAEPVRGRTAALIGVVLGYLGIVIPLIVLGTLIFGGEIVRALFGGAAGT
jgi:hypothetical protein